MNKTASEADEFLDSFLPTQSADGAEVVLCPPWLALQRVAERCAGTPVKVCAQNMFYEDSGAFTGEVSAPMLLDVGVDGTILGHSERRQLFGETDEALARKIPKAIEAGLEPILCVGETQNERESGDTESVLSHQVLTDLAEIHTDDLEKVVIAYEPVWAIGTGLTPTADDVAKAHAHIRARLGEKLGEGAGRMRLLYGGSVKPGNARELLSVANVDGALIGGASLKAADFLAIAEAYQQI